MSSHVVEHSGVLISLTTPFFPTDRLPGVDTPFLTDLNQRRTRVAEWKKQDSNAVELQKKTPSRKEARPCQTLVCPPKKASSSSTNESVVVFLNVTSTVMKLSCSPNAPVSDLLVSGVSFVLRRKPTAMELKDYFISWQDPSSLSFSELPPDSTLADNGVTEGSTLARTVG